MLRSRAIVLLCVGSAAFAGACSGPTSPAGAAERLRRPQLDIVSPADSDSVGRHPVLPWASAQTDSGPVASDSTRSRISRELALSTTELPLRT